MGEGPAALGVCPVTNPSKQKCPICARASDEAAIWAPLRCRRSAATAAALILLSSPAARHFNSATMGRTSNLSSQVTERLVERLAALPGLPLPAQLRSLGPADASRVSAHLASLLAHDPGAATRIQAVGVHPAPPPPPLSSRRRPNSAPPPPNSSPPERSPAFQACSWSAMAACSRPPSAPSSRACGWAGGSCAGDEGACGGLPGGDGRCLHVGPPRTQAVTDLCRPLLFTMSVSLHAGRLRGQLLAEPAGGRGGRGQGGGARQEPAARADEPAAGRGALLLGGWHAGAAARAASPVHWPVQAARGAPG